MNETERRALETRLRDLHAEGALDRVATEALEGYGPELLGFLVAVHRDFDVASEVFARLSEDLWTGLPDFRWASSFRTWAYVLARHASARYRRDPALRRGRRLKTHELSRVVADVRSRTAPWLRTEVKDRVAQLREKLEPDDQMLLVLRIDRELPWLDIVQVMRDEPPADDHATLKREAASLRKRFERVKSRLRKMAVDDGLLEQ